MQTGYLYAYYNNYDIAIQVDGDGQHNAKYINSLILPIKNGHADMVVGSRFITCQGYQSTTIRRLGIKYFEKLIYFLSKKKFTDPTSGFRACNRKVITEFAKYYPVDYPEPETLIAITRKGFRILEVPVIMNERMEGQSSIRSFKTIYYMLKVTLAILIDKFKGKNLKGCENGGTKVTIVPNSD